MARGAQRFLAAVTRPRIAAPAPTSNASLSRGGTRGRARVPEAIRMSERRSVEPREGVAYPVSLGASLSRVGDGDGDDRVGFGGAVSVTIVFDPRSKATAETLETAADPGVARANRKRAMRDARGVKGRFLNTSEAEEAVTEAIWRRVEKERGEAGVDDPLDCGAAPRAFNSAATPRA